MKGFVSLLTLVVAVTAAGKVSKTSSLSAAANTATVKVNSPKNEPIRRLGIVEGFEKDENVNEIDMKLLHIISDMTYPENNSNEVGGRNVHFKVVSENDSGVETYSIGEDNESMKALRFISPDGQIMNPSEDEDGPVKTIRIVSKSGGDNQNDKRASIRLVRVSDEDNKNSPSIIKVIDENPKRKLFRSGINHDVTYESAESSLRSVKLDVAEDSPEYLYSDPEKTKTVKIEGGIVLKVSDKNGGGRGLNSIGGSSDADIIRVVHDHGPSFGRGRKRGRGRGRPPPRGRRPPPRHHHHDDHHHDDHHHDDHHHYDHHHDDHHHDDHPPPRRKQTIRVIHENNSMGRDNDGSRHINPDIQAFQIISSRGANQGNGHHHHHDHHNHDSEDVGGMVYRIRAVA